LLLLQNVENSRLKRQIIATNTTTPRILNKETEDKAKDLSPDESILFSSPQIIVPPHLLAQNLIRNQIQQQQFGNYNRHFWPKYPQSNWQKPSTPDYGNNYYSPKPTYSSIQDVIRDQITPTYYKPFEASAFKKYHKDYPHHHSATKGIAHVEKYQQHNGFRPNQINQIALNQHYASPYSHRVSRLSQTFKPERNRNYYSLAFSEPGFNNLGFPNAGGVVLPDSNKLHNFGHHDQFSNAAAAVIPALERNNQLPTFGYLIYNPNQPNSPYHIVPGDVASMTQFFKNFPHALGRSNYNSKSA